MIAKLKAEIATDPLSRSYSGMTDEAVADNLNAVDRLENKSTMTGSELLNSVNTAEWDALTDANRQKVWNVIHMGEINPFGVEATIITSVFGSGSATVTTLRAARKNSVSRGVELGIGHVRPGNVNEARK